MLHNPATIAGSSATEPSPIGPSVTVISYKMLYVECWQMIRLNPPPSRLTFILRCILKISDVGAGSDAVLDNRTKPVNRD